MHEQTAVVRLPLEGPIFALVEDWRRSQPKIPSRNEAIRLLLWRALGDHPRSRRLPSPIAKANGHDRRRQPHHQSTQKPAAVFGSTPAERFATCQR